MPSSYPRLPAADVPVHVELGRSSESSSCSSTITEPPAAYYAARLQAQDDQLAAFFGTKKPHTARVAAPPSYASQSDIKLPTYDAALAEPKTLARAMFLYGFLFPPFWLMGFVVLATKLSPAPQWAIGRSEEEQTRLLTEMRTAEIKWAKRCIGAFVIFVVVIAAVVVAVVLAKHR